jgi:hypothetical protein
MKFNDQWEEVPGAMDHDNGFKVQWALEILALGRGERPSTRRERT